MITKVLSKKLRADARIEKHSITAVVDLIKRDGRVIGAWGVDYQNGALVIYQAQQVILCTGGGSGLFYVNDNPPQVTGDGYVLGFRAGVPLIGIEMIDFQAMCCSPKELFGFAPHPTGFINAGAVFRNREGEEFLKRYFPDTAEQSTRSEVILAMAKEIHAGRAGSTGGIFMDATKVSNGRHQEADSARVQNLPAPAHRHQQDAARGGAREVTLGSVDLKLTSTAKPRSMGFSPPARRRRHPRRQPHRRFGAVGFFGLWPACRQKGGSTHQKRARRYSQAGSTAIFPNLNTHGLQA